MRDDELRLKYAETSRGKHHTEETKALLRGMRLGEKNPFYGKHHTREHIRSISKPVVCLETGVIYESAVEASRQLGKDRSAVYQAIKKNQRCGGYHWDYCRSSKDE